MESTVGTSKHVNVMRMSSTNDVEQKKTGEQTLDCVAEEMQPSAEINKLAIHYPHASLKRHFFIPDEAAVNLFSYLPRKNSLSLVNKSLNKLNKEFVFLPLLRRLPKVTEQIEGGILLSKVSEEMSLRNYPELARYLAKVLKPDTTENKEGSFEEAFPMLEALAEAGFPTAQYDLGLILLTGEGANQDTQQAIGWFYKAAAQDSADACNKLAAIFKGNEYVQRDYTESVKWSKKGIALKSAQAYADLGDMLLRGRGIRKDNDEALEHYKAGAELGSFEAYYRLGRLYDKGYYVATNYQEALQNYQQAVDGGVVGSRKRLNNLAERVYADYTGRKRDGNASYVIFQLGLLCMNGWHVKQNIALAKDLMEAAHALGNRNALFKLGEWYMRKAKSENQNKSNELGAETNSDPAESSKLAFDYMERAAQIGNKEALFTLGTWCEEDPSEVYSKRAYDYFVLAVKQHFHRRACEKVGPQMLIQASNLVKSEDYESALAIYLALARCENADAELHLGLVHMRGVNVPKSSENVLFLYLTQAASRKDVLAAFVLGNWYLKNFGQQRAKEWFQVGSDCGHADSSFELGKISGGRDDKKYFFKLAHNQGHPTAAYELSPLYMQTHYFESEQDLVEAQKWSLIALNSGIERALYRYDSATENLIARRRLNRLKENNWIER